MGIGWASEDDAAVRAGASEPTPHALGLAGVIASAHMCAVILAPKPQYRRNVVL